jgi:hypothetical protein
MNLRKRFLAPWKRLTYLSLICFVLAQYSFGHMPWQTIFRFSGVITLIAAIVLMYSGRKRTTYQ